MGDGMEPQAASNPRISALIVDDDRSAREALRLLLHGPAVEVIALCDSPEACLDAIVRRPPQVALVDMRMQGDPYAGVELIRQIRALSPATACLALTASDRRGDLLPKAFYAGAHGYYRKGYVLGDALPASCGGWPRAPGNSTLKWLIASCATVGPDGSDPRTSPRTNATCCGVSPLARAPTPWPPPSTNARLPSTPAFAISWGRRRRLAPPRSSGSAANAPDAGRLDGRPDDESSQDATDPLVTVMVVEDDYFARQAMSLLLHADDIELVGVCASPEEALSLAERRHPAVALVDMRLQGDRRGGVELIRALREVSPQTICGVITATDTTGDLYADAFIAGAHGYTRKGDTQNSDLCELARRLSAGEWVVDSEISARYVNRGVRAYQFPCAGAEWSRAAADRARVGDARAGGAADAARREIAEQHGHLWQYGQDTYRAHH